MLRALARSACVFFFPFPVFTVPSLWENSSGAHKLPNGRKQPIVVTGNGSAARNDRTCFYCRKAGHVIADCLNVDASCPRLLLKGWSRLFNLLFWMALYLSGTPEQHVRMLRDTGAAQSLLLTSVLPLSEESCQAYGLEMGIMKIPLHNIDIMILISLFSHVNSTKCRYSLAKCMIYAEMSWGKWKWPIISISES